jgi:PAS domain S-box-containing protein
MSFTPHGFCLLWNSYLIAINAVSDSLIALAFLAIPTALLVWVHRRRDIEFTWLLLLFALFITACGATHLLDVLVIWYPVYELEAFVEAFTALASVGTAIAFWYYMPSLLAMPSQLRQAEVEREQAVARLEQTTDIFQRLVNGVRDYAIYMVDPDGKITTWNSGAEYIKGYRAEEVVGTSFVRFYTEEDRAVGIPQQVLRCAAETGKFEGEGWRVRKDGHRFWASIVVDAIYDSNGTIVGYAKVTRDVTERRNSEQALARVKESLAHSQKLEAIGQLTAGVAHDFNNLLAAILGSQELLDEQLTHISAECHRLLGVIRRSAERGASLTSRLLAFSRKQMLAPEPTDANKVVVGMADLLHRALGEQIAIETVLAAGLWQINIDHGQLETSILNVAINGRDAMPDGGRLTIETANVYIDEDYAAIHDEVTPGPYVVLCVSDTGSGMSDDVLTHAFEPFYTTKGVGKGTGLGLSQVFGFIKQSGGHVKLYSEVGQGTAVKLYLPRYIGDAVAETRTKTEERPLAAKGETILVVEDDPEVQAFVAAALTQLHYRVLTAGDGASALSILGKEKVDLLFTDVGLPNSMNGRMLAEEAQRRIPGLKVLFTTGYARNAIVHNGMLDSGVWLLPKPYTMSRLAQTCREILAS